MNDSSLTFTQDLAYQLYDSTELFPINLDDAWGWLGYPNKRRGKESLLDCGFEEGVDFSRESTKNAQRGRPSDSIWLTIDCFKTWGMTVKTQQGKLIRKYFLECERVAKQKHAQKLPEELMVEHAMALLERKREILALQAGYQEIKAEQQAAKEFLISHHNRLEITEDHQEKTDKRVAGIEAEVGRYSNGVGDFYTILAWARINNATISRPKAASLGKQATKLCKAQGIMPQPTRDVRFGLINSYPECILGLLKLG